MEKLSVVCLRPPRHPSSPISLVVGSSSFDAEAVVSQKYTPGHGRTPQTPVDPEEAAFLENRPHRLEPQSCCCWPFWRMPFSQTNKSPKQTIQ